MMRAAVVLATAALAACQPAAPPAAPGEPAPITASGRGIQLGLSWRTQVSGAGMALILNNPDGSRVTQLACARDPAVMTVTVDQFRAVGSEERLSFGVDDEPFVFVADPAASGPTGVEARASISEDLLRRLDGATTISASYGSQRLGPYMPPDPENARRFAAACRQIATR